MSWHPGFIVWDEREMNDPGSANCLTCEDTRQEAVDAIEELFGYPAVIEDTATGILELYTPKAMCQPKSDGEGT
ncbi:hypothetical protein LCGC14_0441060 [marine sediment metagenome]|uniref:Uncharacterized protein n=1 Tax=marine sediment metagenome TaxID=412755 RepID=A0A0F9SR62_9ZZZZ